MTSAAWGATVGACVGLAYIRAADGAVITPEFGDPQADDKAKATLQAIFPDRTIVQLNIDGIAAGGGGIHCTTQQEPLSRQHNMNEPFYGPSPRANRL